MQTKRIKRFLSAAVAIVLAAALMLCFGSCKKDTPASGDTEQTSAQTNDTTKAPDTTGTSDTTAASDTANTPDTTNVPDTSAPDTANVPDTTKTPDTTSTPDTNVSADTSTPDTTSGTSEPSKEPENPDAKLYLELVQKNIAKLAVGFAATQTSAISLVGEKAEETISQTGDIKYGNGNIYVKSSNITKYTVNKFPVITNSEQEFWYVGNCAYIKNTNKTILGDVTTKLKAEFKQGETPTPSQSLDGVVSNFVPTDKIATLNVQKTTEGTNTVFTFSYGGNINELMNTLPSAAATITCTVTFDKDGNLVSAKATAAFDIPKIPTEEIEKTTEGGLSEIPGLSGLSDIMNFTKGTVEIGATFTSLGAAQDITAPADADQYITVDFEQIKALIGQYMQQQAQ